MWNWQQFVSFIRTLKGRKREQAAFAIAALCFPGGYAVGGKLLPDSKDGLDFSEYVQIGLYLAGVLCLAYTAFRVWRLAHPPELPPDKDRPSAIKGPMAFTEADGELFRKLGRESELQKLLGLVLDDQVLMVVVRGASGAGKTSLLRAGLKHILGDRVTFHYWEAVPTEPDKGLLRAVQEKIGRKTRPLLPAWMNWSIRRRRSDGNRTSSCSTSLNSCAAAGRFSLCCAASSANPARRTASPG
jgi:hypothetical protein